MRIVLTGVILFAGMLAAPGSACAEASKLYDMSIFLNEPYPLAPATSAVPAARPAAGRVVAGAPGQGPGQGSGAMVQGGRPMTSSPNTPSAGYYVSGNLGASLLTSANNSSSLIDIKSSFDMGYTALGAVGYKWRNGLRAEVELGYRSYSVDKLKITRYGNLSGLNVGSFQADGSVSSLSLMANAAYELDTDTGFSPFLLAGAGVARLSANNVRALGANVVDDSGWVPAFQMGIGVNYVLDDRWSVEAGYRFYMTVDPKFKDAAGDKFDSEFSSHELMAGIRYGF